MLDKKGQRLLDKFESSARDFYSYEEGVDDVDQDTLEKIYEKDKKELADYIQMLEDKTGDWYDIYFWKK